MTDGIDRCRYHAAHRCRDFRRDRDGIVTTDMVSALVERAKDFAGSRHHGQVDKLDVSYIHHIADVARRVAHLGPEIEAIAWLHDVVEDTKTTLDEIETGFGVVVRAGVDAMTRREAEAYFDAYLPRLQRNPNAVAVKIADASHNWAKSHLLLDEHPKEALAFDKKYRRVLEMLGAKTEGLPERLAFDGDGWTKATSAAT